MTSTDVVVAGTSSRAGDATQVGRNRAWPGNSFALAPKAIRPEAGPVQKHCGPTPSHATFAGSKEEHLPESITGSNQQTDCLVSSAL